MSFVDHFSHIEDPRKPINLKYDFLDMLFLTVAGVVSGAEGWSDIVDFGYNVSAQYSAGHERIMVVIQWFFMFQGNSASICSTVSAYGN